MNLLAAPIWLRPGHRYAATMHGLRVVNQRRPVMISPGPNNASILVFGATTKSPTDTRGRLVRTTGQRSSHPTVVDRTFFVSMSAPTLNKFLFGIDPTLRHSSHPALCKACLAALRSCGTPLSLIRTKLQRCKRDYVFVLKAGVSGSKNT